MNNPQCESVRDRIPDFVAGRLAPTEATAVQEHLAGCEECREEKALVGLLFAGRPQVPAGLVESIEGHVRFRRGGVTRPWWGLAAAAVAAVALGIGVTSRTGHPDEVVPAYVADMQGMSPWVTDDGLIAGAPALDDLSDEELEALLVELGAGGPGGAA